MELIVKIDNRSKKAKVFLKYLTEMAEIEDFITIEKKKKHKKKHKKNGLKGIDPKEAKKQEILEDIKQALREVKLAEQGKIKLKTARELLDEL
jgi:ribonuclease HI